MPMTMRNITILIAFRGHLVRYLGIILAALVLGGCFQSEEPTNAVELKSLFEKTLGIGPGPSVSGIRCKVVSIGDSEGIWLSFSCDNQAFQAIAGNGFALAKGDEIVKNPWGATWTQDLVSSNPNAPKWWPRHRGDNSTSIWHREFEGSPRSFVYMWTNGPGNSVFVRKSTWQ